MAVFCSAGTLILSTVESTFNGRPNSCCVAAQVWRFCPLASCACRQRNYRTSTPDHVTSTPVPDGRCTRGRSGCISTPAPSTSTLAPVTSTPATATSTPAPDTSIHALDTSTLTPDTSSLPSTTTSAGPACDYAAFTADHSMLKSPACTNTKPPLTEAEKTEILSVHNTLRAKVARGDETAGDPGPQPKGANIRELKWNDELADVAQAWMGQCTFAHDCPACRKICSRDYAVGQNVYTYWISMENDERINWTQAIQSWYDEVDDMPNTFVGSFNSVPPSGKVIGHYTQLVWGESYEIGCGAVHFTDGGTRKIYACNYGAAGNILTRPLYVIGDPASQCPGAVSATYSDLCA
ncbi:venom allergen 5 [Penaeus vannamei]|uniref:venom allergen 5 n=1 Tax=Penaeus vannamei TaxID=6689 RepID=UPI00387FA1B4